MSFSAIGANPSWGTATTAGFGVREGVPETAIAIDGDTIQQANLGPVLACAAINRSGLTLPAGGWQLDFADSGSARPTTGMLYPRKV